LDKIRDLILLISIQCLEEVEWACKVLLEDGSSVGNL